jgi:hypothetical protein
VSPLVEADATRQLATTEAQLVAEFPNAGAEDIHLMVMREKRRFDTAQVLDYVSILVARRVRARLRARTA